jgi:3-dehydroquinate dehydratase type I
MNKICVAIKANTQKQTLKMIKKAKAADIIEIRLDFRKEFLNLESLRNSTKNPLIATNRRQDQGGHSRETERERIQLLFNAVDVGFNYVDIASTTHDLKNIVNEIKKSGAKVILSYHDFEKPLILNQLETKHHELAVLKGDITKIIGWTNNYDDNLPYLEYNNKHPGNISFGMGIYGIVSRVLAPITGAAFTYASIDTNEEVAPGQISVCELKETYLRLKL